MEELRALLSLGAVTVVVIGLVIYFGLKLSKVVQSRAQQGDSKTINSLFGSRLTLTGTVVFACLVGFWIVCLVARQLRPESWLGAFVDTVDGVIAVLSGSIIVAGLAGAILEKLGYPITQ